MKQHKNKIVIGALIIAVLAFVFWYGGNSPSLRGWVPKTEKNITTDSADEQLKETPEKTENVEKTEAEVNTTSSGETTIPVDTKKEENPPKAEMVIDENTGKDKYMTDPVPEGKPAPVEPENTTISQKELTCTLSVRCDTILQNLSWLDSEKTEFVPADGVIFAKQTVVFFEGESVFDLLLREMRQNKIHMEFEHTPLYNSAYIEGIANLYEFDCGELSGWMYKVNDWFPNYGCSRYQLKAGDRVEWVYTCDLGADVGGYYAATGN